jgi:hypothetical protein
MQATYPNETTSITAPTTSPAASSRKTYIPPRLEAQGVWQILTMGSCGTVVFPGDPPPPGCS